MSAFALTREKRRLRRVSKDGDPHCDLTIRDGARALPRHEDPARQCVDLTDNLRTLSRSRLRRYRCSRSRRRASASPWPSTGRLRSTPMNQRGATVTIEVWKLGGHYASDHGIVDELFPTTYRIRKFRYGQDQEICRCVGRCLSGIGHAFLVAAQTPQRSSPKYVPRLSDIMSAVQSRHLKLWAAGQKQNWELAAYELDQVKAALAEALTLYSEIPVTSFSVIETPLKSIDGAISTKNSAEFNKSFKGLPRHAILAINPLAVASFS